MSWPENGYFQLGTRGPNKRIFWIDGGIHAREWAAPHTALFFIHELISRYHTSPEIKRLMDGLTFVIVPNVNPDGYEFTRSSTNPHVSIPLLLPPQSTDPSLEEESVEDGLPEGFLGQEPLLSGRRPQQELRLPLQR